MDRIALYQNWKRRHGTLSLSSNQLIVLVSLFLLLFGNYRFASNVLQDYPVALSHLPFLASLGALLFCVNTLLLSTVCIRLATRPVLIAIVVLAASTAYFMDTYNVIIDDVMIDNILRTDTAEVTNLISVRQAAYFLLLGILPAIAIWKVPLRPQTIKRALFTRLRLAAVSLAAILILLFASGDSYASFFREHKLLRYYTNPTYPVYAIVDFLQQQSARANDGTIKSIAPDATIATSQPHRKLILMIVGETIRADHLSLNGYERETTPLLSQSGSISFSNVWSCGTSTAVSLPCMFSPLTHAEYSSNEALATENVLDLLARVGVNVTWLDNNSDSKGVALRIPYENFKTAETNPNCDDECRDVGMLEYVDTFVAQHDSGDILIVLHQMGNHGPAYYKRYPVEFEKFTPACHTNILENCSNEEIINGYDNAVLYTDYFLAQTIALLQTHSADFATAMVYVGDHGESLGEFGLYLHGLPYALAPETQKHVPLVMWFNENFKTDHPELRSLQAVSDREYSHDNIFHTLLGLTDVSTATYEEALDISAP